MDVFDGTKKSEELSKDQKDNALSEVPSILEVCSQSFFVGGYFVGPQFSMKKFQNFIQRNIVEDVTTEGGARRFALKRFGIGLSYLCFHLLGDKLVIHFLVYKLIFFWNLVLLIFLYLPLCTFMTKFFLVGVCRLCGDCRICKSGFPKEKSVLLTLGQDYFGKIYFRVAFVRRCRHFVGSGL